MESCYYEIRYTRADDFWEVYLCGREITHDIRVFAGSEWECKVYKEENDAEKEWEIIKKQRGM